MIEWPKTLPQDAIVECGKYIQGSCETYIEDDADPSWKPGMVKRNK